MIKKLLSLVLIACIPALAVTATDFLAGTYTHSGTTIPYRLFIPKTYTTSTQYPLVLFQHGAGERGTDNLLPANNNPGAQIWARDSNQAKHPCFVLVPQCPAAPQQWVDWPWASGNYVQANIPESNELHTVVSLLDSLTHAYSIDTNRLYAVGSSMGGFGTWDVITRYTKKFAAAIPVCGAGDPTRMAAIQDMGIWAQHGGADSTVSPSGSRKMMKALETLGHTIVFPRCNWTNCTGMTAAALKTALAAHPMYVYSEYSGMKHEAWRDAYDSATGMVDWLFTFSRATVPVQTVALVAESGMPFSIQYQGREQIFLVPRQAEYLVSVYDLRGRLAFSRKAIAGQSARIQLDNLLPGVYLIRVSGAAFAVDKKLVVWAK
jgi:predicted peptidase